MLKRIVRAGLYCALCACQVLAQTLPATPTVDLNDALKRARAYSPQFLAANIATNLAREDRKQAKAALLPNLNALNQYIYTQGNGTPSGVFVANDGVHVYNEQAILHADVYSASKLADYRRTIAAEAAARAKQDIAARGLAVTVVQNYYALVIAQRRIANARASVAEAQQFLDLTQKQERGGEAAHVDVVKAQLQLQQRQRDQMDAETNVEKARIALGVLLFPDVEQKFGVLDDLTNDQALQPLDELRALAIDTNPDVRAAKLTVKASELGITSARGAYFPTVSLDYFFGIDANVFSNRGPDDRQNLGSAVQATVNVPIWSWGAIGSKVRQARLQEQQAQLDLTTAQRQLLVTLDSSYLEAQAAQAQLASLRSSLDLSQENLRLTLLRYEAGESTALEVVDAQSSLLQARNAYDDGLSRYRLAVTGLQVLAGRL